MKTLFLGLAAVAISLSACDYTYPVAVVGPSETVYRGSATATFLEGGWFQVNNGKNSCQGRYSPNGESKMVTFPVMCSNGLKGVGTATYETGTSGGGEILMQDGTRWKFIFGNDALRL